MGQMRQELSVGTQLRLSQTLHPALIQSIEILQLPSVELAALIKMELEENPALDAGPARLEETGLGSDESRVEETYADDRAGENTEDFERLDTFEADERFRDSFYDTPAPKKSFDGEDKKHEALQNTAARSATLQDYLFEQFNILGLNDLQKMIGEQIIYNIDSNGYLRYRLENIVDDLPRSNGSKPAAIAVGSERPVSARAESDRVPAILGGGGSDARDLDESTLGRERASTTDVIAGNGSADAHDELGAYLNDSLRELKAEGEFSDDDPDAFDSDELADDLVDPDAVLLAESDGDDLAPDGDDDDDDDGDAAAGKKRLDALTASGRYRRRRKKETPAPKDVVPMHAPALEPMKHPRDAYFENLFAEAEEVLAIIRTLDPPGVGAYDLKECLELQVTPDMPHAMLVATLIGHHLDDLKNNRLPKIAKDTGRSVEDIKEAITTLALLNPRPGSIFVTEETAYIVPDVVVSEVDGKFVAVVEDQYIPSLRISPSYNQFLLDANLPVETKQWAKKKIDAARWLQEAIEQRRATLQRVSQTIVDYQSEFFKQGVTGLVPLKMQDVADKLNIHVSTVSRAVSEKYIETPRGVFEMKYFFRGGTKTTGGDEENTEVVKQRVKEIVEAESPANPLSDDAIAEQLKQELGLVVARRTVTKYRKQLGIPSSRARRRY